MNLTVSADLPSVASRLPCRVIMGELGPYLSRYTVADLPSGGHVYLHHFHRSDSDKELHNHPWSGRSLILSGGYREERLVDGTVVVREYRPGDVSDLEPGTFHRVDLLDPEAGCWTLFVVGERVQSWGFLDRGTRRFTPWREALAKRGLMPSESVAA